MDGKATRKPEVQVREFRGREDSAKVADILREAKEAASWSEEDLAAMDSLAGVSAYVSQRGALVSGVIIGRKIADEAEILNLAVKPAARRQGEGRTLVARLLEEFRKSDVSRVFLEVRESNIGAIAFYSELGFRKAGMRKGYYQGPPEAAVVMELLLGNPQVGT